LQVETIVVAERLLAGVVPMGGVEQIAQVFTALGVQATDEDFRQFVGMLLAVIRTEECLPRPEIVQ
jgi:hypothetical protein